MRLVQLQFKKRDGLLTQTPLSSSPVIAPPPPQSSSQSNGKISPVVLFIIIILAVIFFISGILHLFVKFLLRKASPSSSSPQSNTYPEMSGSDAFHRQLQHLFNLHDSGLDQAFIDALPVFPYKQIMGLKEPFDCAVCLCEFSEQDNLRLLPLCGHAFHIDCIDTWLLSNSTCPLCRGTLFTPGFSIENPIFEFDDSREEDGVSGSMSIRIQKSAGNENTAGEKMIFPVRLGKFRSTNEDNVDNNVGETSNSNLDARRCFSMGSFQYVVANSDLQVAYSPSKNKKGRQGQSGNLRINGDGDGDEKRINTRSKGESFSVSKIWLWSKKGKFPVSPDSSVSVNLPWTNC